MTFVRLLLAAILLSFYGGSCAEISLQKMLDDISKKLEESDKRTTDLLRHTMRLELFVSEKFRSSGQSGLKKVRRVNEGTETYQAFSMHDHPNSSRTVGMGEIIAVMSGTEFRTQHNDYQLRMPANTPEYHATQNIPFPKVPPEVLAYENDIHKAVEEMIQWFKAWRDQDHSVRDYRKYFKPILCYIEGAWIYASDKIEEAFQCDRYFGFLNTTIIDLENGTHPVLAQWNYRILCHPLKNDLPLNRLRVVDDLQSRITYRRTLQDHAKTRAARFQINSVDSDVWGNRFSRFSFLDKLMGEIPGTDNYDDVYVDGTYRAKREHDGDVYNTAYYRRGFHGDNFYKAETREPRVFQFDKWVEKCKAFLPTPPAGWHPGRWTYAIPLEVIYLTPLSTWDPYNIQCKKDLLLGVGFYDCIGVSVSYADYSPLVSKFCSS